jgi:hypothetical protein
MNSGVVEWYLTRAYASDSSSKCPKIEIDQEGVECGDVDMIQELP